MEAADPDLEVLGDTAALAAEEAEPPHAAPTMLLEPEPELELEPGMPLPREAVPRQGCMSEDQYLFGQQNDSVTEGSPTSSDKGSEGYREAWITSERLMLAFHDDLVATQEAHAKSKGELQKLRTSSAQQAESMAAKHEEDAVRVAKLEADAEVRDAELSLAQRELTELRAEHRRERSTAAEKQRGLEEALNSEKRAVAAQSQIAVALRRVVSPPNTFTDEPAGQY